MNVQRLHLPAALVLCAVTLSAWTYLVGSTRSGLSVVNHSGAVLRNVEVCLTSGECAVRARLWPHEAWQVPVPQPAGEVVQVRYENAGAAKAPEHRQARVVVHPGGRIRLAQ